MAGLRTNSNSMTAILVVALNNKKSAFRSEFFKLIDLKDEGSIFEDGTHSCVEYPEINNKQVDIIGRIKYSTALMIEVKVGISEPIQPSQMSGGEYEKVLQKHPSDVKKLIYLIPHNYVHESSIPRTASILYWEEVRSLAEHYDNSQLEEYIGKFVELTSSDSSLLSKGELFMLFNQKAFMDQYSLSKKILLLAEAYTTRVNII